MTDQGKKPKILLVDDLEDVLAVLRKLFAACELFEARNAKAALDLAASQKPDIDILDVHLPDMSGVDVMEKLALMRPKPVVIMITGDSSIETAGKSLAAGVFAHITKPFAADELLEQVRKGLAFAEKEKRKRTP